MVMLDGTHTGLNIIVRVLVLDIRYLRQRIVFVVHGQLKLLLVMLEGVDSHWACPSALLPKQFEFSAQLSSWLRRISEALKVKFMMRFAVHARLSPANSYI